MGIVGLFWLLPILWLHHVNGRLLASWHGFLHTAIANQMAQGVFPPENPFYAGAVLPYYWVYHFLGYWVSTILQIDQLHAFQGISLLSLLILVVSASLIGKKIFQSTGGGILIGYLALVGANPLGPVIALAKHYVKGVSLFSDLSGYKKVEDIFVSWELADTLMTQSLLPAMYIGSNWKHGQNLVWFFDISSRTPALALVMVCVLLYVSPRPHLGRDCLLFVLSCLTVSLNPLIGFAMAGSLFGGAVMTYVWLQVRNVGVEASLPIEYLHLLRGGICILACVLAYPAYYHLFEVHQSTIALSSFEHAFLKFLMIGANFILLLPLALLGTLPGASLLAAGVWSVTFAGILLIGAVPIFSIKPGNEHNLTNLAQCFLAVSAVWGLLSASLQGDALERWRIWILNRLRMQRHCGDKLPTPQRFSQENTAKNFEANNSIRWLSSPGVMVAVAILCIPTTIGTLLSYTGRPPIPLAVEGRTLIRLPPGEALNSLYVWIRKSVPPNAIFVIDPQRSVKMSGNVDELPAFTGRALFVGSPTYMTQAYQDRKMREHIAYAITHGQELENNERVLLGDLEHPTFILSCQADHSDLLLSLVKQYGSPVFQKGFIAVFQLA